MSQRVETISPEQVGFGELLLDGRGRTFEVVDIVPPNDQGVWTFRSDDGDMEVDEAHVVTRVSGVQQTAVGRLREKMRG